MSSQERTIESYLHTQIVKMAGVTRKYTSPGFVGVADRICFLPGGVMFLVEVKTMNGKESLPQKRERKRMIGLGFNAVVVHSKRDVDCFINSIVNMHGLQPP